MPYTPGSMALTVLLMIPTLMFVLICKLSKPSHIKMNEVKFSNSNLLAVLSKYSAGVTIAAALTAYFWLPYVDTPEFGLLQMLGEWARDIVEGKAEIAGD